MLAWHRVYDRTRYGMSHGGRKGVPPLQLPDTVSWWRLRSFSAGVVGARAAHSRHVRDAGYTPPLLSPLEDILPMVVQEPPVRPVDPLIRHP